MVVEATVDKDSNRIVEEMSLGKAKEGIQYKTTGVTTITDMVIGQERDTFLGITTVAGIEV